jgi:hypothetical protein
MKDSIRVGLSLVVLLVVCLYLVQGSIAMTISGTTAQLNGHQLTDRRLARLSTKIEYCNASGLFVRPLDPGSGGGQPPRCQ